MIQKLQNIYDLFEIWAGDFDFACTEGCATCCTQSVTMTTLEGELILDFINTSRPELKPLLDTLPLDAPAQGMTTNQFARACLREEETDEGTGSWSLAPCMFLQENRCSIYPARSFMCRSFGSRVRCDISGEAEVEPLFLTLNTIILQCIEHLDHGRPWGNMNMVLRSLTACEKISQLLQAEQIPGFLVPPEELDRLHDQLHTLIRLIK